MNVCAEQPANRAAQKHPAGHSELHVFQAVHENPGGRAEQRQDQQR